MVGGWGAREQKKARTLHVPWLFCFAKAARIPPFPLFTVDDRFFPAVTFASLDDAEAADRWLLEQGIAASCLGLAAISAGSALVIQLGIVAQ